MVEQHRGPRVRDLRAEVAHVGLGIVERELDAALARDVVGLARATGGDAPGIRVAHHLGDRALGHRAGARVAHVADELLPHELVDVVEALDAEARALPDLGDSPEPRRHRPGEFAEADELPAVVMRVPRPAHRRAEAAHHADRDALAARSGPPRPFWIESTTVSATTSRRALTAAAFTSRALVAMITSSQGPASAASAVAFTRTVRSPEAPSTRRPLARIASTCSR